MPFVRSNLQTKEIEPSERARERKGSAATLPIFRVAAFLGRETESGGTRGTVALPLCAALFGYSDNVAEGGRDAPQISTNGPNRYLCISERCRGAHALMRYSLLKWPTVIENGRVCSKLNIWHGRRHHSTYAAQHPLFRTLEQAARSARHFTLVAINFRTTSLG